MTFYERIESLRKARRISQGALEKELGFSNGSISKWKNSMPTPERLKKLSEFFQVSVDYLVSEEETMIPTDYSFDPQTIETIRRIYENDRVLFDVYRSADKDRLVEYAKKLKELQELEKNSLINPKN